MDSDFPEVHGVESPEVFQAGGLPRVGYIAGRTFNFLPVQYAVYEGLAFVEADICIGTLGQVESLAAELERHDDPQAAAVTLGIGISGDQFRWTS